jgi:cytochrome c553
MSRRRSSAATTGPIHCRWLGAALCSLIITTASAADVDDRDDDAAVALFERIEQAAAGGDSAQLAAVLEDDVRWTVHASSASVPFGGAYRGIDGVIEHYARRARYATFEPTERSTVQSIPEGIVVRRLLRATVPATGAVFDAESLVVFELEQGRVSSADEYLDSQAVAEAFIPADAERGRAWFTTCAGCHGNSGEGNVAMNAPNLTGQSADYLVRQLRHFASEIRGGRADNFGWQMNGRARSLPGDRAWRDVIAYIQTLPVVRPAKSAGPSIPELKRPPSVGRGKTAYVACIACHGELAQGVPAVDGPALTPLDDWYLVRQLQMFRSGVRGSHAEDKPGQQMRASVTALSDDAIADIAAYIATLP